MKSGIRRNLLTKRLALLVCIPLLIVFGVSGTLAYIVAQTDSIVNQFHPAEIEGEIDETFENNIKTSIKVKNTGTADCYVRLLMIPYWVDNNNQKVGVDAWDLSVSITDEWFQCVHGGLTYYYCKNKVPVGSSSDELLSKSIELKTDGTLSQALDIFAECIQAEPADAVEDAWDVTVGEDGTIAAAAAAN